MITITRFSPRSHDFLTISHDFLRAAARLAVAVLAALLIAVPAVSEAESVTWTWLYSSDRCSYYLDSEHVWLDEYGLYHYSIKTVYVDEAARQRRIAFLSRLAPDVDFSNFSYDIIPYFSLVGGAPRRVVRHPRHLFTYDVDDRPLAGFDATDKAYAVIRHGSVDEIVDAKARSWAVYRSYK